MCLGYSDIREIQIDCLLAFQIKMPALLSEHPITLLFQCQFLVHLKEVIAVNVV